MKKYIRPTFITKPFTEITEEELRSMVRERIKIPLKELFDHYGINSTEYMEKLHSFGMVVTNQERREVQFPVVTRHVPTGNPNPFKREAIELSRVEMIAVRLLRGFTRKEMAARLGKEIRFVDMAERYDDAHSKRIRFLYAHNLRITTSEIQRIRMALSGQLDSIEIDRSIPSVIRQEVYERYNGRCGGCESTDHLHIHHKVKFSNGGRHDLGNLELLCSECHAEKHKNDKEYHLLKSIAERARQLS